MIRVVLPYHLRTLAKVDDEVQLVHLHRLQRPLGARGADGGGLRGGARGGLGRLLGGVGLDGGAGLLLRLALGLGGCGWLEKLQECRALRGIAYFIGD